MHHSKQSETATLILRAMLFSGKAPQYSHVLKQEDIELWDLFGREVLGNNSLFRKSLHIPLCRHLYEFAEGLFNPGFIAHVIGRKLFIDDLIRKEIQAGMRQVVIVGAGFDPLGARLAYEYPEVQVIELDHPNTQSVKLRGLSKRILPSNLSFTSMDLSRETMDRALLRVDRLTSSLPVLWISEGVFMYLHEEQVASFLSAIRGINRASTVLFTFMEADAAGNIKFKHCSWSIQLWLRWICEPFQWGIAVNQLPSFLERQGFRCRIIASALEIGKTLQERGFVRNKLAEGETIVCADATL